MAPTRRLAAGSVGSSPHSPGASFGRSDETEQHADERCFACAVRPEEGDDFARSNGESDRIERPRRGESMRDRRQLSRQSHAGPFCCRLRVIAQSSSNKQRVQGYDTGSVPAVLDVSDSVVTSVSRLLGVGLQASGPDLAPGVGLWVYRRLSGPKPRA